MLIPALISALTANVFFLLLYISGNCSFPKPLSPEEEKIYLKRAAEGDPKARDVLIERNLRLVVHIIKKYYANSKDQDDLISIGTIGLIKAISSFDLSKNTRLATYAARCIENEILMYFRSIKKMGGDISLNDTIDSDGDGNVLSLIDILSCEDYMLENVDLKTNANLLYKYIDSELTSREKRILMYRYGLCGHTTYTQQEIAQLLNISRSYVSRIEKKAIGKLQAAFVNNQKPS